MNSEQALDIDPLATKLDRLGVLKEKGLLTEVEFEEARRALAASLVATLSIGSLPQNDTALGASCDSIARAPFGYLHDTIVSDIARRSATDPATAFKEGAYASIARMAEARALNEGDSAELIALVEEIDSTVKVGLPETPSQDATGQGARLLLQITTSLTRTTTRLRTRPGASPAAIAIADTAQQSATTAAQHAFTGTENPPVTVQSLWRRLVLPDLDGAFDGACAAVDCAKSFEAMSISAIAIPMAAALGVVIGAGIRSGHAYREKAK